MVKDLENNIWVKMMCVCWCITEVVRYLFYALGVVGLKIPPVTWLRYSMFPILYPLGVAGELGVLYHSEAHLQPPPAGHCGAPGRFLQSFSSFKVAIWMYVLGLPMLMMLMFGARKKA